MVGAFLFGSVLPAVPSAESDDISDAVASMREHSRYLRGVIGAGFDRDELLYEG